MAHETETSPAWVGAEELKASRIWIDATAPSLLLSRSHSWGCALRKAEEGKWSSGTTLQCRELEAPERCPLKQEIAQGAPGVNGGAWGCCCCVLAGTGCPGPQSLLSPLLLPLGLQGLGQQGAGASGWEQPRGKAWLYSISTSALQQSLVLSPAPPALPISPAWTRTSVSPAPTVLSSLVHQFARVTLSQSSHQQHTVTCNATSFYASLRHPHIAFPLFQNEAWLKSMQN